SQTSFPVPQPISHISTPFYLFRLFFSCRGYPRDLHSFPTRRSSDLVIRYAVSVLGGGDTATFLSDASLSTPRFRLTYRKLSADRDRKSTRLNSSHVAISYAVFCSKKKSRARSEGAGVERQRMSAFLF